MSAPSSGFGGGEPLGGRGGSSSNKSLDTATGRIPLNKNRRRPQIAGEVSQRFIVSGINGCQRLNQASHPVGPSVLPAGSLAHAQRCFRLRVANLRKAMKGSAHSSSHACGALGPGPGDCQSQEIAVPESDS